MKKRAGSWRLLVVGPAIDSPARSGRWRLLAAWLPVLRFTLLVACIGVAFSFVVTPLVKFTWWQVFRRSVSVAAFVSLWICVKRLERRSFRAYGWALGREESRQLALGLLLGLGALGLWLGISLLTGACQILVTDDRVRLWRTVIGFIPAALLVAVLEELVFRGFLFQHLLEWSRNLALCVTSTAYALVHLRTFSLNTSSTWLELTGLWLLGTLLALSYLRTRRLAFAIGLHATLAYGARINKLLVTSSDPSLSWLVGTNRLINGMASWAALLGIWGIMMWWTRSVYRGGIRHEPS